MNTIRKTFLFTALASSLLTSARPAAAEEDYDMDCAVILCIAGGFPVGCAPAYQYMLSRLLRFPPKPPFGFCLMGSAADIPTPPDEDSTAAIRATLAQIDDINTRTALNSVRVEISRGTGYCNTGGQSDREYKCSDMITMRGDGSNFFMGSVEGWQTGKRITFIDHEGRAKSIGDARKYVVTGQNCYNDHGDQTCNPVYGWIDIATPAEE